MTRTHGLVMWSVTGGYFHGFVHNSTSKDHTPTNQTQSSKNTYKIRLQITNYHWITKHKAQITIGLMCLFAEIHVMKVLVWGLHVNKMCIANEKEYTFWLSEKNKPVILRLFFIMKQEKSLRQKVVFRQAPAKRSQEHTETWIYPQDITMTTCLVY